MADQWLPILTAVGAEVAGAPGCPTPVIRKDGVWIEGDVIPMVLVCSAGEERPVEYAFMNLVHYEYPVFVLYVDQHNRDFTVTAPLLDFRKLLIDYLDQRALAGASTIDAELKPVTPFTFPGGKETVYNVTGVLVSYMNWETRRFAT